MSAAYHDCDAGVMVMIMMTPLMILVAIGHTCRVTSRKQPFREREAQLDRWTGASGAGCGVEGRAAAQVGQQHATASNPRGGCQGLRGLPDALALVLEPGMSYTQQPHS
eukprot:3642843-Rhodomonas_salina.2